MEFSTENKRMFWMPPGFARGFLSLADGTDLLYTCTVPNSPADEGSIRWDDPQIGTDWPLDGIEPSLSAKDAVTSC